MNAVKKIILIFLLWRILLFAPLIIANRAIPYRPNTGYTNLKDYVPPHETILPQDLSAWANFDGVLYLRIAHQGYTNDGRFFPAYPLLIHTLQNIFPNKESYGATQFFIAFVISNFAFVISLFLLYKLLRLDYSENITWQSLFFLLTFPTAFFYGALYTESLFLLFSLLSFYLARKKHWFGACLSALVLSVIRPVGLLILPALVWEYAIFKKYRIYQLLYFIFIPSGLVAYAYFCYRKWGDALYFLHAQADVGNSRTVSAFIFPLQTVYRYLKILIKVPTSQYEWWIALVELMMFAIGCYLLYLAIKKKMRFSYLLFSTLAFLIPVISGTFTGLPRYLIVLFPIYTALALAKNKYLKFTYVILSIILSYLLISAFSRGYYVA